MKKCIVCEKDFIISKKGSGGKNRKICFNCMPEGLTKQEREILKTKLYTDKARQYKKSLGCSVCGYNKSPSALEWHHPESSQKDMNPSDLIKRSWEAYEEEIKKCILLCANCHREEHDENYMGVG